MSARLCALLALLLAPGCRGVPAAAPSEVGAPQAETTAPSVELHWSRPFGAEGEVPAALIAAGPERLFALSDRALYLLDLEGRVIARSALPAAAAWPGGVSSLAWDGRGLGLALRWRGDASAAAGGYLGLTDPEGAMLDGLVRVTGADAPLRGGWDGDAHRVVWLEGGDPMALRELRVPRGGTPSLRLLADGLEPGLALGELLVEPGPVLSLCSLEADGRVLYRRFAGAASAVPVSGAGRRAIGPCLVASAGPGRGALLAWKNRALAVRQEAGVRDGGLKLQRFDEPVARAVRPEGTTVAEPIALSRLEGTLRIESLLWDGARYLVLLAAAGVRGGRLFLAILDEAGRPLARDVPVPVEVEPAALLPAAMVAGPGAYTLLYGLRRPWDEGVLYLARFSVGAPALDAR